MDTYYLHNQSVSIAKNDMVLLWTDYYLHNMSVLIAKNPSIYMFTSRHIFIYHLDVPLIKKRL